MNSAMFAAIEIQVLFVVLFVVREIFSTVNHLHSQNVFCSRRSRTSGATILSVSAASAPHAEEQEEKGGRGAQSPRLRAADGRPGAAGAPGLRRATQCKSVR